VAYVVGILPETLMWRPEASPRRMDKPLNNTGRRDGARPSGCPRASP